MESKNLGIKAQDCGSRSAGVFSEQSLSVNRTPRHEKDLHLVLETTPMASDSEWKSSASEPLIKPTSRETNFSPKNLATD